MNEIIEKFEKYSTAKAITQSITAAIVVGGVVALSVWGNVGLTIGAGG